MPANGRWDLTRRLKGYPFKSQWSIYVPLVLTFRNSVFCPQNAFMCFAWISEQIANISLYSINWLVFINEEESVYCAVRTGSLNQIEFRP